MNAAGSSRGNRRVWSLDLALIAVASGMVLAAAYLHAPLWKMYVMYLPIPFTMAVLAVGKPINATNVLGIFDVVRVRPAIRWFHYNLRVPIIPSIAAALLIYALVAVFSLKWVPQDDLAFWCAMAAVALFTLWVAKTTPDRQEPGHRTPLPIWVKLPVVVIVVCCLGTRKELPAGISHDISHRPGRRSVRGAKVALYHDKPVPNARVPAFAVARDQPPHLPGGRAGTVTPAGVVRLPCRVICPLSVDSAPDSRGDCCPGCCAHPRPPRMKCNEGYRHVTRRNYSPP